jgi:predicted GIY-YIG superfamily endonuclease
MTTIANYMVYILSFNTTKFYVGVTKNLDKRIQKHKDNPNRKLIKALKECSELNVTVLEENLTKGQALILEKAVSLELDTIANGYNLITGQWGGVNHPNYGKKVTEETRNKMRDKTGKGKKVLCTSNNRIYNSISAAAREFGISESTLRKRLSGPLKNNTDLILIRNKKT